MANILEESTPKWGNIFNFRKYKHQVQCTSMFSAFIGSTVYSVWQEQFVKAIVSSLQQAKPRKRYTCTMPAE